MALFEIKDLSFTYPLQSSPALDYVSLDICEGDFVIIYGKSGCGKTTLLKHLKPELFLYGQLSGNVFYKGKEITSLDRKTSAEEIAYIPQNTYNATVAHKVYKELAFCLECLGYENSEIYLRIAECSEYFGISPLFERDISSLSGGERRIVNIAACVCLDPSVLILDEPFSQLDPISCKRLASVLQRLSTEKGITVIVSEHRLEDIFSFCNKLIVMDEGKIVHKGNPETVASELSDTGIIKGFPSYVRVFYESNRQGTCPKNITDARLFLKSENPTPLKYAEQSILPKKDVLTCKNLYFSYGKDLKDVISDLEFSLKQGEILSILGGNGSGKSTLLKALSGINKPYKGSINVLGKPISKYKNNTLYKNLIAYLPQNPLFIFSSDTVAKDIDDMKKTSSLTADKSEKLMDLLHIRHLLNRNPRDLSGGELQKCALYKILFSNPKILLLDEPSKGLDSEAKDSLKHILKLLSSDGVSILVVTHDLEFACEISHRCAMLFGGELIALCERRKFFGNNKFYTTPIGRITSGIVSGCFTDDDIKRLFAEDGEKSSENQ